MRSSFSNQLILGNKKYNGLHVLLLNRKIHSLRSEGFLVTVASYFLSNVLCFEMAIPSAFLVLWPWLKPGPSDSKLSALTMRLPRLHTFSVTMQ